MRIIDAEKLAIESMTKHGLIAQGWKFDFLTSEKAAGVCNFTKKAIGLSIQLTRLNDVTEVTDTILHEIAHALAGPAAGHGPEWKAKALEVGCRPEARFSEDQAVLPKQRYSTICEACGTEHKTDTVKLHCFCQSQLSFKDRNVLEWTDRRK